MEEIAKSTYRGSYGGIVFGRFFFVPGARYGVATGFGAIPRPEKVIGA